MFLDERRETKDERLDCCHPGGHRPIGSIILLFAVLIFSSCYDIGDRDNPLDPGASNYIEPTEPDDESSSSKIVSSSSKKTTSSSSIKASSSSTAKKTSSSSKNVVLSSSSVPKSATSVASNGSSDSQKASSSSVTPASSGTVGSSTSSKTSSSSRVDSIGSSSLQNDSKSSSSKNVVPSSSAKVVSSSTVNTTSSSSKKDIQSSSSVTLSATSVESNGSSDSKSSSSKNVVPSSSAKAESSSSTIVPSSSSAQIEVLSSSSSKVTEPVEVSSSSEVSWTCGVNSLVRDGVEYKTVVIKEKCFTKENLRYVPQAGGNTMCYENKDANCKTYGLLYDFEAASLACPTGWRLPTSAEFIELQDYSGDDMYDAGTHFKATSGWTNENGDDFLEFTGLPGGYCDDEGCRGLGSMGYWWTSTEKVKNASHLTLFLNGDGGAFTAEKKMDNDKFASVRCVKIQK